MKIYTIQCECALYDSDSGYVIVANNENEVREIAKEKSASEDSKIWETAEVKECGDYTCHRTEPFVLLSSFDAG